MNKNWRPTADNVIRIVVVVVALLVVFFCLRLLTFGQVCDCKCGDCVCGGDGDVTKIDDIAPEYSTQFGFRNASGARVYWMRTDGAGDNAFNFSDIIGQIIRIATPGENVTFLRTIDGVQLMVNGTAVSLLDTFNTSEEMQDAVGGILNSGEGVDLIYDDANDEINGSFDCSDVTDATDDHLTCDGSENLIVSDDWVNISGDALTGVLQSDSNIETDADVVATNIQISDTAYWGTSSISRVAGGRDLLVYLGTGRDNYFAPYYDNEYSLGNSSHRWRDFYSMNATIYGDVNITSVSGDGSGKVVCIKADGNLGTCSDAPGAGGTCTCS